MVKRSANPNATDKNGWTPLMIAAHKGHASIVSFLANDCHSQIESMDKAGKTANDRAKNQHIRELISSASINRRIITSAHSKQNKTPHFQDYFAQNPNTQRRSRAQRSTSGHKNKDLGQDKQDAFQLSFVANKNISHRNSALGTGASTPRIVKNKDIIVPQAINDNIQNLAPEELNSVTDTVYKRVKFSMAKQIN